MLLLLTDSQLVFLLLLVFLIILLNSPQGHRVLLDDGILELKVLERYDKDHLLTEVVVGGYILLWLSHFVLTLFVQKAWRKERNQRA